MMDEKRYILTIQNQTVCREIRISLTDSSFLIGTTPECSIRLKRELFTIPISLSLSVNENGCRLSCGVPFYFKTKTSENCHDIPLEPGDYLEFWDSSAGQQLFVILFSYDFFSSPALFDTIVDIRSVSKLLIGGAPHAQIRLNSPHAEGEGIILSRRKDGNFDLEPLSVPKSITLNGDRIFSSVVVREYDFIGVAGYSFYFKNGVLYTAMRQDIAFQGVSAEALREETPAFEYPKLNRSPRMKYLFDDSPIEILDPPQKPEKPKENLILQLSPALLMIAITVITRSGVIGGWGSGNLSFLIFSLSTMAVGVLTSAFMM